MITVIVSSVWNLTKVRIKENYSSPINCNIIMALVMTSMFSLRLTDGIKSYCSVDFLMLFVPLISEKDQTLWI
jgi:hypothetical protein